MANEIAAQQNIQQGEIILYQPDETVRLEVRLEDDTVWLNQAQMGELFGTNRQAITKHLQNIYDCGELAKEATSSILELVRQEGKRTVKRKIEFYNLDVIISVGFRVNTRRGIEFRQWANRVLKDYMLRGYALNMQITQLRQRIDDHVLMEQQRFMQIESTLEDHQEKIDFFVRTNQPPVEGIFYDGQIFDAYRFVNDLIRKAKQRIVLIDNYVDDTVLTQLDKREGGVTATIYTQHVGQQLQLDIDRHNAQYRPIRVEHFNRAHDRFLLVDDEVYHIGASLKDLGRKWFAFTLMHDLTAEEIIKKIN